LFFDVLVLRGCEGHRGVLTQVAGGNSGRPRPECHFPVLSSCRPPWVRLTVKCYP
jgi:hypothetical protein